MSIYIPGMAMPQSCGDCPFMMEADDVAPSQCGRTDYTIRDGIVDPFGKPEWCDLVELPPHGRLIDADALISDIRKHSQSYFADDFAHEWVDVAPTIIPADKDKEVQE